MRAIYRLSCPLDNAKSSNRLDEIAAACLSWIVDRPDFIASSQVSTQAQSISRTRLADRAYLEAMRVDDEDGNAWAAVFEHRDSEDDRIQWRSEIGVQASPSGAVEFSFSTLVGNTQGGVAPFHRAPARPRLIPTVLQRFAGRDLLCLTQNPIDLASNPKSIGDFLTLLYHPDRRHPLVVVSARNLDDRTCVDGPSLANWLAGLAYTVVARDRFPSLTLRERLPQHLNCWDGAVRIYWPNFRSTDPAFRHRWWPRHRVLEIESEGPGKAFREMVLGLISSFAVFNVHDRFITWNSLLARHHKLLLKQATDSGDFGQLAEAYARENDTLRTQVEQSRTQIQELNRQLVEARGEADAWREAYQQERRGETDAEVDENELPLTSVSDAVERAKAGFSGKLAFALNTRSDVDKNPFESPDEVFEAFAFLATIYRDAKIGAATCPDLDAALKNTIDAWSYSGGQSEITMTKYKSWYQCSCDGTTHWLGEHIGTGRNKDPRYTIRIAFAWDKDGQKVIIGFIGQHQRDDNT